MAPKDVDLDSSPDDPERGEPGKRGKRCQRSPERLAAVARLLKLCYANDEIERHFAAKWNVSRQTVKLYIQEVFREWKENSPPDPEERKRSAEALAKTYQEAVKRGELKAGIRALEVRAKLLGLFIEKHEVSAPGGAPLNISIGDVREQLASRLIKRVGATPNAPRKNRDEDTED